MRPSSLAAMRIVAICAISRARLCIRERSRLRLVPTPSAIVILHIFRREGRTLFSRGLAAVGVLVKRRRYVSEIGHRDVHFVYFFSEDVADQEVDYADPMFGVLL